MAMTVVTPTTTTRNHARGVGAVPRVGRRGGGANRMKPRVSGLTMMMKNGRSGRMETRRGATNSSEIGETEVPGAYVDFAKRLARAAGEVTTKYFRARTLEVEDKRDASPVTIADQTAEAVMRTMVTKEHPTHAIFGEEHGIELGAGGSSEWTWVFDPIDGTKSFITGKPLWGTLIALLHNGEPVLGVLDQPVLKEQWVGVRGRVSTMNGEPISVKRCENIGDAYMYSTTPLMFEGMNAARYDTLASKVKIPMFGCDCYAYGLLAMGFADLVVEADLKPYDYMALVPIVKGAGGYMTDWKGEPLRFTADAGSLESGDYQGEVIAAGDADVLREAVATLSKTLF
jgi:inositol-phosphate phosphatase/L-galactose 1-phosphate phosphatase/histidinol-phosphatase